MTAIKIWHPDLQLVGESTTEAWNDKNPFRLRGWEKYPATALDATNTLGRHITDLFTLSDAELIEVAKASAHPPVKTETIKEVLARVGTDKDLAAAALAVEKEAAEPRKTLVADLEAILAE